LAIKKFEDYYKSRHNRGLESIDRNQDIDLAKELFKAWDAKRRGFISFDLLSSNLISMGLAMSQQQVLRLINLLHSNDDRPALKVEDPNLLNQRIELKFFIRIFERDSFGDKAIKAIK
jgi:hypothetical protein